jgi:hypothetical protein
VMWPVAGVSPTARDLASTAAWSCLVVVGASMGSMRLSLPAAHGGGLLRCWGGGGRLVDGSMVGGAPSSFDEVNW